MPLPPFQQLMDAHGPALYRFLAATAGPDADDCYQETLLAALRAYPGLTHGDNLRAWLFTIAHHKALDSHRARARRPVPVGAVPDSAATDADAARSSPVWLAVRRLPPKQREAVVRRFVADLPYADIATAMGCSQAAARRSVFEGLRTLKENADEL